VVLTGATSGIGEATALRLAGVPNRLILLGGESEEDVARTLQRIRRAGAARVNYFAADFARLAEVADAAARVRGLATSIDLLINVGSSAHRIEHFHFEDVDLEHDYSPVSAYARAKLAMVTWSSLLAGEEAGTGIQVVALCPGLNDTPLSAAMTGGIGGPPSNGAARVLYAASAAVPSGSYLEDDQVVAPSSEVVDTANRSRLTALFQERLASFAGHPTRATA